jgi:hypothetical protein
MVTSTGYRFLRTSEIEGTLECDGEDKHLSKYEEDGLCLELLEPFRAGVLPAEYSELEIRYRAGRSSTFAGIGPATFKVVMYEPGDWEQTLLDWPEPIPFN